MTETLPVLDRARLDAGLAQLRKDRKDLETLKITSPAMALAVAKVLIDALKQHDALQAERDRVVMPIHSAYKNASETYAPHLKESKACIDALKAAIGAWELEQHQIKEEAFRLAQAATVVAVTAKTASAQAAASQVMSEALTVAHQETGLGPGQAPGVSVRLEWAVKRFDSADPRQSMLPSEYWTVDMAKIEQETDRQKKAGTVDSNRPPIIPGIVFELVPAVTGRRKG